MKYSGKYKLFDQKEIRTYPVKKRTNKLKIEDIISPSEALQLKFEVPDNIRNKINILAEAVVSYRKEGKPVIIFTGAHMIKNGLSALIIDMVKRGLVTLIAGNGATAIHDFEIALIGQTSENVPSALGKGSFGMAYEFNYINSALQLGNKYKLGFGEVMGKFITDKTFIPEVLNNPSFEDKGSSIKFLYPDFSISANCYNNDIPFTVHAGIGTDVIDQHQTFDGQSKGGCSGRDFLIFANEITKFVNGGIFINIGSAITGPEVLLKAVSMSCNIGKLPRGIVTADFDLRTEINKDNITESSQYYYFRDQKSIVLRIPEAFNGNGYYLQEDQNKTIPLLYQNIIERL